MWEKFHQLLAVGRWFPPGTPVSSTRKLISSSFHRLDMTLAVAEALNPNKNLKKCEKRSQVNTHKPYIFGKLRQCPIRLSPKKLFYTNYKVFSMF